VVQPTIQIGFGKTSTLSQVGIRCASARHHHRSRQYQRTVGEILPHANHHHIIHRIIGTCAPPSARLEDNHGPRQLTHSPLHPITQRQQIGQARHRIAFGTLLGFVEIFQTGPRSLPKLYSSQPPPLADLPTSPPPGPLNSHSRLEYAAHTPECNQKTCHEANELNGKTPGRNDNKKQQRTAMSL
jgi:hypothetical protein